MIVRDVIFLILWCFSVQYIIGDTVDFSKMGITHLRRPFLISTSVTHLNLSDNHVWKIENNVFDDLPNLVYLNLTNNLIDFYELSFGNNASIETLVLDRALIDHAADYRYEKFGLFGNECSRLTEYENMRNYKSDIMFTKSLFLPKLKHLYLRRNNILSIIVYERQPLEGILPEITHIYLTDNSIKNIDFIKNIPMTLTHLYLDYNDLKDFDIDNLNNVEVLALDGNPIERFCGIENSCNGLNIQHAFNLKILTISHMNLGQIEADAFKFLGHLVELDMSYNKIRYFPEHALETLLDLKTFRLDGNKLSELPDIYSLKNLEDFSASNNSIFDMKENQFSSLSKLRKINLTENRLNQLPAGLFDNLTSLEELDLSKNKIYTLPDNWISPKINLQYLYLNNNHFPNSSELSLASAKNLKFVAIGGNYFNSINIESLIHLPKNATVNFENKRISSY